MKLWLDREAAYRQGDRARVYVQVERSAYLTVLRVDTDGRVRILFPADPWADNFARGGRTFEVLNRSQEEAFLVDDYPGVGYVFAVASVHPFRYSGMVRGEEWDYRLIAGGALRGDPYVALTDFAGAITADAEYDYDLTEYDVERHYDYPRFLCYDCHTYVSYSVWDPYRSFCSRFRLVVYDDPYYYPYRTFGGRRVVVAPPPRLAARYVFKDADGRTDYLTRVRERPSGTRDRTRAGGDRSNADIGGRGAVPAPVGPSGRTAAPGPPGTEAGRRSAEATGSPPVPPSSSGAYDPTSDILDRAPRRAESVGPERRADPPHEEPGRREPKPDSPRVKEPDPRTTPPPRSTGEPELRRRKPQ